MAQNETPILNTTADVANSDVNNAFGDYSEAPTDNYKYASTDAVSAVPDAQNLSTYFPSAVLQQPRMQTMPGRYFGALPVFSGGEFLYPQGVEDARRKAIEDAAFKQAAQLDAKQKALNDKFNYLQTNPAYATKLNEEYFGDFHKSFEDVFNTLGRKRAVETLNDPANPITNQLMKKYATYATHINAVKQYEQGVNEAEARVAKGEVLDPATQHLVDQFKSGQMSQQDMAVGSAYLPTFLTLADRAKDIDLTAQIGRQIDDYYMNGLPDENGKLLKSTDKEFVGELTKKFLTPEALNTWTDLFMRDPRLSKQYKNPQIIQDYLRSRLPTEVASTVNKKFYDPLGWAELAQRKKEDSEKTDPNAFPDFVAQNMAALGDTNSAIWTGTGTRTITTPDGKKTKYPALTTTAFKGSPIDVIVQEEDDKGNLVPKTYKSKINAIYNINGKIYAQPEDVITSGSKSATNDLIEITDPVNQLGTPYINQEYASNPKGADFVQYTIDKYNSLTGKGAAPQQPQAEETKTIGSTTYIKVGGNWYQK